MPCRMHQTNNAMNSVSKILLLGIAVGLFAQCSKNSDPSATSSITLKMSAVSTSGKSLNNGRIAGTGARVASDTSSGITLTDVMVNVRSLKFDFDERDRHFREEHHEKDTACYDEDDDIKLRGPFLVDLMNAGSFVDQVVAKINIPAGVYERVRFKLAPSMASGEMRGKSIMITGKIDTIPFVFWHRRDANFGARFHNASDSTSNDSTSVTVNNGKVLTLAIRLELDKILRVVNDGIDLTKAVDGNKDGVITIDPNNDDGNKWIADHIMMLLIRHARCEKRDHDN